MPFAHYSFMHLLPFTPEDSTRARLNVEAHQKEILCPKASEHSILRFAIATFAVHVVLSAGTSVFIGRI